MMVSPILILGKGSNLDENDSSWRLRRFKTLQREAEACESALRSIAIFLHWSIHPEERKKRSGGGGGAHGGASTPNVVERGAGDEDEEDDGSEPSADSLHFGNVHSNRRSRVGLPNRWRNRRSEKYRVTIKAGDHTDEASASQPQALSGDAAGAAFARGGGEAAGSKYPTSSSPGRSRRCRSPRWAKSFFS
jgi:hypothetical protein